MWSTAPFSSSQLAGYGGPTALQGSHPTTPNLPTRATTPSRRTYTPDHDLKKLERPSSPKRVIDLLMKSGELGNDLDDKPSFTLPTRTSHLHVSRPNTAGSASDEAPGVWLGPKSEPGKLEYRPLTQDNRSREQSLFSIASPKESFPSRQIIHDSSKFHHAISGEWDPVPTRIPVSNAVQRFLDNAAGQNLNDRSEERFTGQMSTLSREPGWVTHPGMNSKLTSPLIGLAFTKPELKEVDSFWEGHFGHKCPYSKTKSLVGGRRCSQPSILGELSRTRGLDSFAQPKYIGDSYLPRSTHSSQSSRSRKTMSNSLSTRASDRIQGHHGIRKAASQSAAEIDRNFYSQQRARKADCKEAESHLVTMLSALSPEKMERMHIHPSHKASRKKLDPITSAY